MTCWYCQRRLNAGLSLLAAPPRGGSIGDPLSSILWAHQYRTSLLDPFLPLASHFLAPRHRNTVAILSQPRRARRHRGSTPAALLRPIQHHWKFPLGPLKLLEQNLVAQPARCAAVEILPVAGRLLHAGRPLRHHRNPTEHLPG
jgi:hypothetical protein